MREPVQLHHQPPPGPGETDDRGDCVEAREGPEIQRLSETAFPSPSRRRCVGDVRKSVPDRHRRRGFSYLRIGLTEYRGESIPWAAHVISWIGSLLGLAVLLKLFFHLQKLFGHYAE